MTYPLYPHDLLPDPVTLEFTVRERRRADELEGSRYFRAFYRSVVIDATIRWRLSPQQLFAFNEWFDNDLVLGVLWFEMKLAGYSGRVARLARFVSAPAMSHVAVGVYDVSATLELREVVPPPPPPPPPAYYAIAAEARGNASVMQSYDWDNVAGPYYQYLDAGRNLGTMFYSYSSIVYGVPDPGKSMPQPFPLLSVFDINARYLIASFNRSQPNDRAELIIEFLKANGDPVACVKVASVLGFYKQRVDYGPSIASTPTQATYYNTYPNINGYFQFTPTSLDFTNVASDHYVQNFSYACDAAAIAKIRIPYWAVDSTAYVTTNWAHLSFIKAQRP